MAGRARPAKAKPKPGPKPEPPPAPGTTLPAPGPPAEVVSPAPPPGPLAVAAAVEEINRLRTRSAAITAFAIAGVALRVVDGDEERLALAGRDPELRQVVEHPGAEFIPWELWRAIGVYLQAKLLAPEIVEQLSLTIQTLLLGIPDVRAKRALAARAVDMTKREVAAEVTEYRQDHDLPPQGRPPDDPAEAGLRKMGSLAKEVEDALAEEPRPAAERETLARAARRVGRAIEAILDLLEEE